MIFHSDGPMTVIEMGPFGTSRRLDDDDLHRGVGELMHTPSFFTIGYTHEYDAELAVTAMKRRGQPRRLRSSGVRSG